MREKKVSLLKTRQIAESQREAVVIEAGQGRFQAGKAFRQTELPAKKLATANKQLR